MKTTHTHTHTRYSNAQYKTHTHTLHGTNTAIQRNTHLTASELSTSHTTTN